jgi:hypothetical protein
LIGYAIAPHTRASLAADAITVAHRANSWPDRATARHGVANVIKLN